MSNLDRRKFMGATAAVTVTGAAAAGAVVANLSDSTALGGTLGWRMIEHAKAVIRALPGAGLTLSFVSVDCMSKEEAERVRACGMAFSGMPAMGRGGWRMSGIVEEGEEIEVAEMIKYRIGSDEKVANVAGGTLRLDVILSSDDIRHSPNAKHMKMHRGMWSHEISIVIGERPAAHRDDFESYPALAAKGETPGLRLDSAHPLSVTEAKIEKLGEEMTKRANEVAA